MFDFLPFTIAFSPYVADWVLYACGAVALVILAFSIWRRASGAFARIVALAVVIFVLANPQIVRETREGLNDIVAVVVDRSASQEIGTRKADTDRTLNAVRERLKQMKGLEVREADVRTDAEVGTPLFGAIDAALGQVPPDRLAGTLVITDGQAHDAPDVKTFKPGAPMHVLLTGGPDERDRKLTIVQASRFQIVGKQAEMTVKVEDPGTTGTANVTIRVDGRPGGVRRLTIGEEMTIRLPVAHGGENIIELEVARGAAEQTLQNNRAVVVVNGVRDRMRVLLVSGQPHAGERVWRDLLKADPSVDLVHFTILRSPDKLDDTPIEELSLIQFPTRELFDVKLSQFDLVVFDRYQHNEFVLPPTYLENIARYVENGGALLLSSGPELANPELSVYRTALAAVLPVQPTGEVVTQAFRPEVTSQGLAHPVTQNLDMSNTDPSEPGARQATWGHWYRLISSTRIGGTTLMDGPGARPLLVLDRVGKGRVAQLLADQTWLWARGFEGGGPQAELLRRLAHWLMKEPDLEEERLQAEVANGELRITRRTMAQTAPDAQVTAPSGEKSAVSLGKTSPGVFSARVKADELGLYHVVDGNLNAVAAAGPLNPREVADMRATDEIVKPYVVETGGGIRWIKDGMPELREVTPGSSAEGNGWLGIARRGAYRVTSVDEEQLLPPWVSLLMVMGSVLFAWKRESK
jgi:uncharacterized membrane protein